MEIKDISELPILRDDSKEHLEECLQRIHTHSHSPITPEIKFKEFWNNIEDNGVPTILKYGRRYIIIRGKIEMTDKKMVFVELSELPKTNKGKTGNNWLDLFAKIPVGKMWVVDSKEYNSSTIRQGLKQLIAEKKVKEKEYSVTQREDSEKKLTMIYVIHNDTTKKQ